MQRALFQPALVSEKASIIEARGFGKPGDCG
jgi:hypothetical protein